jgi:hypothetical protein
VSGVRNLCEHILCPKGDTNDFHHKHCIQGECAMCGVLTLQICPCEMDNNTSQTISWCQFEKNWVGKSLDGKDRHALCLE